MLPSSSSASPAMAMWRPGGSPSRAEAVQPHVVRHQRGERGHRHAQPDRSGREIDLRPVLHPAGIGLHAAHLAQPGHLLDRLPAEQVVHRVEHRAGVRLHRDAVLRAGDLEIQRRHDGDHRRARRLVPAHLQPVAVGPDVVGVVHHPGRQPQQLALKLVQQVRAVAGADGRPADRRAAGGRRPAPGLAATTLLGAFMAVGAPSRRSGHAWQRQSIPRRQGMRPVRSAARRGAGGGGAMVVVHGDQFRADRGGGQVPHRVARVRRSHFRNMRVAGGVRRRQATKTCLRADIVAYDAPHPTRAEAVGGDRHGGGRNA